MTDESGSGAGYASSGGDSPTPSPSPSHGTPGTASLAGPSSGSPAQAPGAAAADGADPKKLRACEACRGLKVRCEPDPNEGPCKRCKKAGRNCVVTAPTRKRQKKTDSRVSELEKKIDALTASLQARTGSVGGGGVQQQETPPARHGRGQEHRNWDMEVAPWETGRPADQDSHFQQLISMAGRKRKAMDDSPRHHAQEGGGGGGSSSSAQSGQQQQQHAAPAGNRHTRAVDDDRQPSAAAASVGWPAYASRSADGDVVDRGLVPLELAARLFSRYKSQMVRHLPGVVFPPSTTIAELRRTRPILFLAVMAAAAGEDHALQRVLQRELMQIFAQKVIVTGEKTLELVQALNVAVIWYWPPEYFEELKFYQLIHISAVMAIDIGLGRKTNGRVRRNQAAATATPASMSWRVGDPSRKAPPPDPTSLEARRTWLTCYYLSSNTAMSLHRPNLIRWTKFMAESMAVLESAADAAPTDKYFCHLVWTHHLGEQIGTQLSMDDPDAVVDIADARTQYALRALERDLERYKAGVPPERMQATLRIGFDLLNLYMHETVLHADNYSEVGGGGFSTDALRDGLVRDAEQPLSAQHVNALTSCLAAINGIFATFLGLEVESIRCLPVFNFVRVAYAVVVLMKMFFSASSAGSDFGAVFTRESMRVQEHLDALLDKFRKTAADDRCRPASKFLVVLAMLRSWFVKQGKTTDGGSAGAQENRSPGQQQQTQTPQYHQQQQPMQANTPLHLLSEVATGSDPSNNPGSASSPFGYYRQQQQQQQQQQQHQQPFFHDAGAASTGAESSSSATAFTTTSGDGSAAAAAAAAATYPPWIAEAMLSSNGFDAGAMAGDFPTAMGMGAIEGLDGSAATNDQFWTDMFQGIPDPNMFTF
ncbi:Zn(2)-C6 fungal-type DNA-binding domain protein [Akanthomyces lecanii RCEF 1005]|uniref:Zn(2)-C6 fungal-type DNA-binding domain protein n=1 Tax=Akanthomyces lecanii RCEF 1005 TaxID=1081108 RepID=A0A168L0P0_CORDF|nr:Zn(2)-C6 fungal-type DNA-binding domain protein [Akanthomyces lecanii RCEF 1005]